MWKKFIVPDTETENATINDQTIQNIYNEYTSFKVFCVDLATSDPMEYQQLHNRSTSVFNFWKCTGRTR